MSDKQTYLKDKAYGFVPLIGECRRSTGLSQHGFEPNTYSGKWTFNITVCSPLHIGQGRVKVDEKGRVVNLTMRRNGCAIIPGSSIKGVVRGIAEAVSHSCAVKLPDAKNTALERALPHGNHVACSDLKGLCPACSIFGMSAEVRDDKGNRETVNYKGKVEFGEFTCIEEGGSDVEELPLQQSPFKEYPKPHDVFSQNVKYGNERIYYCKACDTGQCGKCKKKEYRERTKDAGKNRDMKFRGRKFYYTDKREVTSDDNKRRMTRYEMLQPNNVLKGEITYQNMRREELSLLAYAMNVGGQFQLKLGYGKPLGCGKVKIELCQVEDEMERYGAKALTLTKEEVVTMANEYKTNKEPEIMEAIKKLEHIMGGPNGKVSDIAESDKGV